LIKEIIMNPVSKTDTNITHLKTFEDEMLSKVLFRRRSYTLIPNEDQNLEVLILSHVFYLKHCVYLIGRRIA
jgi:hypothetical protein